MPEEQSLVTIIPADEPLLPATEAPAPAAPAEEKPVEEAQPEQVEAKEETEGEQERDEKGRFKGRVQERIDELTRKGGEKEREAAYWRGMYEQATKPAETKPADDGRPKREAFESEDAYIDALTDWKLDSRFKAQEAKAEGAKRAETWAQRAEAAKAEMPDFDEVLQNSSAPMSRAMQEVISESDKGPALVYHLAKNPAEAERIARMSPLAAASALGKLEASLTKAEKAAEPSPPPQRRVTTAPAPSKPIGSGRSTEVTSEAAGQMSMNDYMAWRANQMQMRH